MALFRPVFERDFDGSVADFESEEAPRELLPAYEAPALLRESVEEPRRRLLIVSPRLTPEIVTADFIDPLRRRLAKGAEILIGIGPERENPKAAELERSALRPLEDLYRNYRNLRFKRFVRPALLARDNGLAVLSRFNWLGHEGDLDRHYVDERGLLLKEPEMVDELFARQIPRFD